MKNKQKFIVVLEINQDCEEDMTESEMKQWVASHFVGCDYGNVAVTGCELQPKIPTHRLNPSD